MDCCKDNIREHGGPPMVVRGGLSDEIQESIKPENIGILKAAVAWTPEQSCHHAPWLGSATLFPGTEHPVAGQGGRQAGVEE